MARVPRDGARATLRDVARIAGVHPGTVSRALNPETEALVRDETVRRVRQVATELGYRPNPLARGLKTNRSYTVGVIVPDIQNPLFPPIIRGLDDRLGEAGYTPLIANTDNDPARERVDFEAMRARQVDGIVTATARVDHELLDEISASGTPLVLVNRRVQDGSLPSATADDHQGARMAVEHLVELGHTRIAHLAGPQDVSTGRQRFEGFARGDAQRRPRRRPGPRGPRLHRARGRAPVRRAARRGRVVHRRRGRQRPDGARLLRRASRTAASPARPTSASSASTTCRSPTASARR